MKLRGSGSLVVVLAMAAGMWMSVSPPSAHACTCAFGPSRLEDNVREQVGRGRVFVGTPTERHEDVNETRYRFEVHEIFKGDRARDIEVTTNSQGTACGSEFTIGTDYLMFAVDYTGSGGEVTVNSCSATTVASDSRTSRMAERVYGAPEVVVTASQPISATLWLSVAAGGSLVIAVGGALLLGRRRR